MVRTFSKSVGERGKGRQVESRAKLIGGANKKTFDHGFDHPYEHCVSLSTGKERRREVCQGVAKTS